MLNIREKLIVGEGNLSAAFKQEDLDWITLMTCTRFDAVSGRYMNRLLVRAVLIEVEP